MTEYELKYTDEDYSSTVKFSAAIKLEDLRENLRYFLLSAGWTENQVIRLISEDD